jgi:dipeptide/tripeptide permease
MLPDVELVSKSAHESLLNIEGKPLPAIQIPAKTKNFSNIYAEKLEVEKLIAHHYDEKHNILNLFLVGEIVNFDLMRFEQPYIKEQGFETPPKPGRFLKNRIVYYVVVPKYYDRFIFKYFNSAKARFETIENPINILDDRVVTAKDIKPTSSDRNRNLKIAILLFVAALFYWLYYKKKGYTYIFFGGLFTMLALQYFIPKAKICVRPGAVVRVLPMTSSTIFTTIKGKKYLEKVYEYGEFIKIKTPNSSEGWIKKKDVCNKD